MVQLMASWRSAVKWCKKLSWRSLRFPALFFVSVALLISMYRLRSDRIDKEEAEKALLVTKTYVIEQKVARNPGSIGAPPGGGPISTKPFASTPGPAMAPLWPDDADLSEVASHERWVVVSGADYDEDRAGGQQAAGGDKRTSRSGAALGACAVAAAARARGWRPIVIGEAPKCCRLPDCIPLDGALVARLPYRVLRFLPNSTSATPRVRHPDATPLRNAAFLFAIQHGARFVFDAYPPSGGDRRSLAVWADEIFSSMTLGSTVGLVLDGYSHAFPTPVPGAPSPRVLNPYAHFGRPDLWALGYDVRGPGVDHHVHDGQHLRYRVCEIRQPSVEMFLDVWDGGSADTVAPPVTVPVNVLAPHSSRNVLYTRDALWGLALLPDRSQTSGQGPHISPHLARSLWNHALLGASSDPGGVRFTLLPTNASANTSTLLSSISLESSPDASTTVSNNNMSSTTPTDPFAYIATFTSRVIRWRCRCTTLLPCLSQMASDFLSTSLLTTEDAAMLDAWVADLRRVRYLPPPVLPWAPRPPPRPSGPCVHPPHHHHRQSHDPPLPHPTTLTFHPIAADRMVLISSDRSTSSLRKLIARFHRDAALLEWSGSEERTKEELSLVKDTLAEDHMLPTDEESQLRVKVREDNLSRKNGTMVDEDAEQEETAEEEEVSPEEEPMDVEEVQTGPPEKDAEEPVSPSPTPLRTFLGDTADHICPGFAPLVPPLGREPKHPSTLELEHILLVVWFPRPPRYDLLPTLELIRSRHFPNALFCGPPHRALPSMLSRFESRSTPSFLTATSRSDCLLTALEMGYRVGEEGSVLLVEESALPIPWMLSKRNRSLVWFHKTGGRGKRGADTRVWDIHHHHLARLGHWSFKAFQRGTEESVIMAAEGLASALRFVARVMGMRPNPHLHPHHHHPMDDIDHEDVPWGKMSTDEVSTLSNRNESTSVVASNETTPSSSSPNPEVTDSSEKSTEVEVNSTEQPQAIKVDSNNTKSQEEQVENVTELTIPEHETFASVEHVDTPSVEYSEPVLLEHGNLEHVDTPSVEYSEPVISEHGNLEIVEAKITDIVPEVMEAKASNDSSSSSLVPESLPTTNYNTSPSVIHIASSEGEAASIDLVLEPHQLAQENSTEVESLGKELDDTVADAVTSQSNIITEGHANISITEWPPNENSSSAPWNDDDARFEVPSNLSLSDWVMSSEAEEILSSITMIENASENITEQPDKDDSKVVVEDEGTVTEYLVDNQGNVTQLLKAEGSNTTLQQTFEFKSAELYEEERDKGGNEPTVDGEQSLGEGLLSYKDVVGDSPQFISTLPSPNPKARSIKEAVDAAEEEEEKRDARRRRDAGYAEGGEEFVMDKEQQQQPARRPKDSQDQEGEDKGGKQLGDLDPRLSQSLEEIEELFSELAREFPEDADAVLKEDGNPNIMQYPSRHYGLDHTDFRHLHCDYREEEDQEAIEEEEESGGGGESRQGAEGEWSGGGPLHFEPCTVLRRFFLRLHFSHKSGASMLNLLRLATTRGSAPVFHLPMRLQRELHLTASLLLSQGFPEEAVIPLLVYGLAGESGWVNLKKGKFVDDGVEGTFPALDVDADFIHPTNLRAVAEEPRMRSVFCLKFLLRVLDG
ncbi:uncharacterized protein [Hetaerina americana]|uniref:uncharacterized protein n=1 Tax=Hetaerina americana TaxID=62018 RepID=UPI003A7F51A8